MSSASSAPWRRHPLLLAMALLGLPGFSGPAAAAPHLTWTAAASTTWNFSSSNWSGDAAVFADGDFLTFGDPIPSGGAVIIGPSEVDPGEVDVTNTTGTYTISGGAIGGSGAIVKSGAGTLVLSSSNNFTGGAFINGGILAVDGGDTRLGDPAGAVTWDGGTLSVQSAALVSSRNFLVNAGGGTINTNGQDSSTSGSLSGGGTFTKSGLGDLAIGGAVGTSSQSIPLSVLAGSLTLTGANTEYVTASTATGNFAGDLNIDSGVTLNIAGAANFSVPVLLNGGGTLHVFGNGASLLAGEAIPGTPGAVEIDNAIVLNSQSQPQPFSVSIGATQSNHLSINGALSGNSDVHFVAGSLNDSPLIVVNTAATYTGNTFLGFSKGGVLRLGQSNALPVNTELTFQSSSGALDLNGFDQTVAALSTEASANGITNTGTNTATLTVNQSFDTTYASDIGTLANLGTNLTPRGASLTDINLVKQGAGALRLLGNDNYTGTTTVAGGTLVVNGGVSGTGGITSTSGVSVTSGGTLAGQGLVAVAPGGKVIVESGGTISPGDNFPDDYTTGLLTLSDPSVSPSPSGTFDLRSGGILYIALDAFETGGSQDQVNSDGGYDSQLVVKGRISLAGNLSGSLLNGFTAAPGDLFFIILNQGADPVSGTFAGNPGTVTLTGPGGTKTFFIGYTGNSTANTFTGGNDVVLEVVSAAVPEPGSTTLFLAGAGVVACRWLSRRRRRGE